MEEEAGRMEAISSGSEEGGVASVGGGGSIILLSENRIARSLSPKTITLRPSIASCLGVPTYCYHPISQGTTVRVHGTTKKVFFLFLCTKTNYYSNL